MFEAIELRCDELNGGNGGNVVGIVIGGTNAVDVTLEKIVEVELTVGTVLCVVLVVLCVVLVVLVVLLVVLASEFTSSDPSILCGLSDSKFLHIFARYKTTSSEIGNCDISLVFESFILLHCSIDHFKKLSVSG